jgi:excisionase family DNA binding protein
MGIHDDTQVYREAQLLDARDVAVRLGVSVATVRRMVTRGELRTVRIGPRLVKFPSGQIDAIVASTSGQEQSVTVAPPAA